MLRIPTYLTLVFVAAGCLAQSAQGRERHHRHHTAASRSAQSLRHEVARSSFYGPFGGYFDAAANAGYAGPNARHYFGYPCDELSVVGPETSAWRDGTAGPPPDLPSDNFVCP